MYSLGKIPFEIHTRIVQCLNKKDLLQYQIVCKNWHMPATEMIYESIYISTLDQLIKLVDTLAPGSFTESQTFPSQANSLPRYESFKGSLIRSLEIDISNLHINHIPTIDDALFYLVRHTPNMKSVKVDPYTLYSLCRSITKTDSTDCHWKYLQQWDMQDIDRSQFHLYDRYYEALVALRGSLTEIDILYIHENQESYGDILNYYKFLKMKGYHKFLATRSEFRQVTTLSVVYPRFPQSVTIEALDCSLGGFPNLSLVYLFIDQVIDQNAYLNVIEPRLDIKCLKVSIERITKELLDYLRIKFPSVDRIELLQSKTALRYKETIDLEAVRNFISYLQHVGCFKLVLLLVANDPNTLQLFKEIPRCKSKQFKSSKRRTSLLISSYDFPAET
ncbi:hypothetical protein BD560DRAFT_406352 [Blakeslea trispora]|nr:hypothetical protein BD560DRAFT_406352 [Blakeslea trispora]